MTKRDAFHAHLDKCKQCEREPFGLCKEGERLLKEAAQDFENLKVELRPDLSPPLGRTGRKAKKK